MSSIFLGAQVVGAHWYARNLVAVLSRITSALGVQMPGIVYQEVYLTIESRCAVFAQLPATLPDREDDLPDLPLDERVGALARLAGQNIADVALGEPHPHLILTFESGSILFLNGYHEEFESWNARTSGAEGGEWTVVAVPGGNIAIFDPRNTVQVG